MHLVMANDTMLASGTTLEEALIEAIRHNLLPRIATELLHLLNLAKEAGWDFETIRNRLCPDPAPLPQ